MEVLRIPAEQNGNTLVFQREVDNTYALQNGKLSYTVTTVVETSDTLMTLSPENLRMWRRHLRLTPHPLESASTVVARLNNLTHRLDPAFSLVQSLTGGDVDEYAEASARKYYLDQPNSHLPGKRRVDHPVYVEAYYDGAYHPVTYTSLLSAVKCKIVGYNQNDHHLNNTFKVFEGTVKVGSATFGTHQESVAVTFDQDPVLWTRTLDLHLDASKEVHFETTLAGTTKWRFTHRVSHPLHHPILGNPISPRHLRLQYDVAPQKLVEAADVHVSGTYSAAVSNAVLEFEVVPAVAPAFFYHDFRTIRSPAQGYKADALVQAQGVPDFLLIYLTSSRSESTRTDWYNRANTRLGVVTSLQIKTPNRTYFTDYDQHRLYEMSKRNGSPQLEKHFRSTLGSFIIVDVDKDLHMDGNFPFHYTVSATFRNPLGQYEGGTFIPDQEGAEVALDTVFDNGEEVWTLNVVEQHAMNFQLMADGT